MINPISKVKELEKILRSEIITQSELDEKRVANSLSIYGETLDKLLNNSIADSYEKTDSVILFELSNRDNPSDISYTDTEENIIYNKSYRLNLIIYGDSSPDIANKITMRFRTENVRDNLFNEGVYIEEVTDPSSFNEFINDVMWLRTDLSILLTATFKLSQINKSEEFKELSDLKIIKKGE